MQILFGILAILCVVYLVMFPLKKKGDEDDSFFVRTKKTTSLVVILMFVFVILAAGPFAIVQSGNNGLKFTFGKIEQEELLPGLYFKVPFAQVIRSVSIQPQKENFLVPVGLDGAITKDNQTIGANIEVFFVYQQGQIVEMYQNYGVENIKTVLKPIIIESFKEEVGNYVIFDLPTNQDTIRMNVDKQIRLKTASYPIEIREVKITNYDWSDEFDRQIEETMQRTQAVKKAEQDLKIAEQDAQRQVKEAEGAKLAAIAKAEGEKMSAIAKAEGEFASAELLAKAKAAEGRGIRDYNEYLRQNWEIELQLRKLAVEMKKAEKWDGKYVPINHYGPIPFTYAGSLPGPQ